MAKRTIIWTLGANLERREILAYWIERNKSKLYSIKLNKLFIETVRLLSESPEIGRLTNDGKTRVQIVRNYLVFYDFTDSELIVLSIWDSRRNESDSRFQY